MTSRLATGWCVAALLLAYALAAGWAASGKSLTNDEPYSLSSALVLQRTGDYRVDPEDPPLWKRGIGLLTRGLHADLDVQSPAWNEMTHAVLAGRLWSMRLLHNMPAADVDVLIFRGRGLMLVIAVVCGGLIAVAAYQSAGPIAAVAATVAAVAYPAFIAHGPLVRADVAFMTVTLALALALRRLLERVTPWRVLAVGLIVGIGFLVKLSAVLFPIMIALALVARAIISTPWPSSAGWRRSDPVRELNNRRSRLLAAAVSIVVIGGMSYSVLWAGYGFRFAGTPVGQGFNGYVRMCCWLQRLHVDPNAKRPTDAEYLDWHRPMSVQAAQWAYDHHALPESWLTGFIWVICSSFGWPHFFLGQVSTHANLMYYPVTLLVKSPVSWLIGLAAAAVIGVRRGVRPTPMVLAAGSIVLVYGATVVTTDLNEGIRHLLPLFPFACVAMGIAAATVWPKPAGRRAVIGLAVVLVIESAVGYPNDLAYFHALAGGSEGGIKLLGDSDLDWGQDLPLLAAWQRAHPDVPLYYAHYGASDPDHYGIHYFNLPGGYPLGGPPTTVEQSAVIAIDATLLQGINASPGFDPIQLFAPVRKLPQIDVLGGTIYLYSYDAHAH